MLKRSEKQKKFLDTCKKNWNIRSNLPFFLVFIRPFAPIHIFSPKQNNKLFMTNKIYQKRLKLSAKKSNVKTIGADHFSVLDRLMIMNTKTLKLKIRFKFFSKIYFFRECSFNDNSREIIVIIAKWR